MAVEGASVLNRIDRVPRLESRATRADVSGFLCRDATAFSWREMILWPLALMLMSGCAAGIPDDAPTPEELEAHKQARWARLRDPGYLPKALA